jgi:hypothetical protein
MLSFFSSFPLTLSELSCACKERKSGERKTSRAVINKYVRERAFIFTDAIYGVQSGPDKVQMQGVLRRIIAAIAGKGARTSLDPVPATTSFLMLLRFAIDCDVGII